KTHLSRPDGTPVTDPTPSPEPAEPDPILPTGSSPPLSEEPAAVTCSQCGAVRASEGPYCGECGYIFAADVAAPVATVVPDGLIAGRFRLLRLVGERGGVARFLGQDEGTGGESVPVVVLRQVAPPAALAPDESAADGAPGPDSQLEFDLPASAAEQE